MKSTQLTDHNKAGKIDILIGGKMTVVPPSIHPETKRPYIWQDLPLYECRLSDLPVLTQRKLDLLKFVVGTEETYQVISGTATHSPGVALTAKVVAFGCTDDEIKALFEALLPADYQGDSLAELQRWITSAREKGFDKHANSHSNLQLDDLVAHVVAERLDPLVYVPGDGFRHYIDGYWRLVPASEIDRLAKEILRDHLKPTQQVKNYLGNVRECLRLNLENSGFGANLNHICLLNGALNTETGVLEPHAPEHQLRFQLNFAFDPAAACPIYEDQMRQTLGGDQQAIATFEEFAGLTLVPDTQYQKALYLIGEAGSGKSTILRLVEAMHDPNAVSVTALPRLEGERYLTNVVKRQVCISYDTQTDKPIFGETFIRVTGGDPLAVRRLYQEVEDLVHPTVRFMGCMNYDMPKFIASADALMRRLIFLECASRVETPDRNRSKILHEERAGILNRWITALRRLRARGDFDPPSASAELVREYAEAHNPVEAFVGTRLTLDMAAATPISEVTREYNFWAEEVGEKQTTAALLGKALRAAGVKGGKKMINGQTQRVVFARLGAPKERKF